MRQAKSPGIYRHFVNFKPVVILYTQKKETQIRATAKFLYKPLISHILVYNISLRTLNYLIRSSDVLSRVYDPQPREREIFMQQRETASDIFKIHIACPSIFLARSVCGECEVPEAEKRR